MIDREDKGVGLPILDQQQKQLALSKDDIQTINMFVRGTGSTTSLEQVFVQTRTLVGKLTVVDQTLQQMCVAIERGEISQGTFNRKMLSLLGIDTSMDRETGKRSFSFISKAVLDMVYSEDEEMAVQGNQLCSHISTSTMIKIGMVDSDVCSAKRIVEYMSFFSTSLNTSYLGNRELVDVDIFENLAELCLDRDDDDPGFIDEIIAELQNRRSRSVVNSIVIIAKNGSEIAAELLDRLPSDLGPDFYDLDN